MPADKDSSCKEINYLYIRKRNYKLSDYKIISFLDELKKSRQSEELKIIETLSSSAYFHL